DTSSVASDCESPKPNFLTVSTRQFPADLPRIQPQNDCLNCQKGRRCLPHPSENTRALAGRVISLPSPSLHSPSEHELWCTFPALEASRPFRANGRGFLSDQLCPMDWTNTVVPSSSSARWRCIRRTCRRTLALACWLLRQTLVVIHSEH